LNASPSGISGLFGFIARHLPIPHMPMPVIPGQGASATGSSLSGASSPGSASAVLLLAGLLMLVACRSMRQQSDRTPVSIVLSNPVPPG
jgi:hypothetical protein